jgi:hypothetical protein
MTELIWMWSALLALLLGALSLPWSEGMAALAACYGFVVTATLLARATLAPAPTPVRAA